MFYRGPEEVYSNQQQLTQAILLGQDEQDLIFNIANKNQTIESLRLHLLPKKTPVNISYIKLYGLQVKNFAGDGTEETLLSLNSAEQLQKHAKIDGFTLNKKVLGELYVVEKPDPTIELHLFEPITIDPSCRLQIMVSMEYLFGNEYLLARDHFLVNQEKLEQQMRSMEADLTNLKSMQEALATYKNSPFWTTFISMHQIYERFVRARDTGLMNACLKVFRPAWWVGRRQTGYERWRTAKGYENREKE